MNSFINNYINLAHSLGERFNICYMFILAVASLETGFGKKVVKNNFFNIKATPSWKGERTTFTTHEYITPNGKRTKIKDSFRAYTSAEHSFEDFCILITNLYPQCVNVYDSSVCSLIVANPKRMYASAPYYARVLTATYNKIKDYLANQPDLLAGLK